MKTVADLIAELREYPDDTPVYVAIDPEGNGFNQFADVGIYYTQNLEYSLDSIYNDMDEAQESFDEYDEVSVMPQVVVIWP